MNINEQNVGITDKRLYNIIMSATTRILDEIKKQERVIDNTTPPHERENLHKIRDEVDNLELITLALRHMNIDELVEHRDSIAGNEVYFTTESVWFK